MKPRIKFETQVLGAFAAAVLMLALLASAAWVVTRDANEAARTVTHTHETLTAIKRVRAGVLLLESLTRSYVISGDDARLPERQTAISGLETALVQVRSLLADDAGQKQRWARMRVLADQRIATSERSTQLRQAEGFEAAHRRTS